MQLKQREIFDPADAYDAIAGRYDDFYRRRIDRAENRFVHYLMPSGGSLLDLACGTGLVPREIEPLVEPRNYLGVDASAGMIEQARRHRPDLEFDYQDIDFLDVGSRLFDRAVLLFGAFSYLRKPLGALRRIRRHVVENGEVLIMAYGEGHVAKPGYCLANHPEVYRHYYTRNELRLFMFNAGFKDVRTFGWRRWPDETMTRLPVPLVPALWVEHQLVRDDDCYFIVARGRA